MTTPGTFGSLAGAIPAPVTFTSSPDIAGALAPVGIVLGLVMASAVGILLLAADRRRPAPLAPVWPGHGALVTWRMLAGTLAALLSLGLAAPAGAQADPDHLQCIKVTDATLRHLPATAAARGRAGRLRVG
jgi:hypothetical protein